MQIGFDVRSPELVADADQLVRAITTGEQLGFDYTTFSDHLVSPVTVESKYPYDASGKAVAAEVGRHEQLTAIAFMAAKTRTLRFVTSVMVAPYRPAVLNAKVLATIDVLSGGRLTIGVGTGWMKEEFDALGAPDFAKRGRATDEYLEVFKALWTQSEVQYEGTHVRFQPIRMEPKPVQKPHPPIWIGGLSDPAMRRAARFGDAWYPVPNDQKIPLDSLPRLRAGMEKMNGLAEAAGRAPGSVGLALRLHKHGQRLAPLASDGERQLFSGSWTEIADDLKRVRDLGLRALDFRFAEDSADQVLAAMEAFQREVLARV